MRTQIFVMTWFVFMIGCDMGDANRQVHSEEHAEENSNLRRVGVSNLDGKRQESITIMDVVLQESDGGYYTDNRFMCKVRSRVDCELWLEVCDYNDGHRFSDVKDETWTRREVSVRSDGSPSTYNVGIVVDGSGERTNAVVTLWGRTLFGGEATILFKTNAVLGTWKGR